MSMLICYSILCVIDCLLRKGNSNMAVTSEPQTGLFYFIDEELTTLCPDAGLMDLSKGNMQNRPCLCVAKTSDLNIFWMVPLSSKVEKYTQIYNNKIKKEECVIL